MHHIFTIFNKKNWKSALKWREKNQNMCKKDTVLVKCIYGCILFLDCYKWDSMSRGYNIILKYYLSRILSSELLSIWSTIYRIIIYLEYSVPVLLMLWMILQVQGMEYYPGIISIWNTIYRIIIYLEYFVPVLLWMRLQVQGM